MLNHSKNQDKINNAVLAAYNIFRNTIDPTLCRDYILSLLFLKNLSDLWQDHYERFSMEYEEEDPQVIEEIMWSESFMIPEEMNFEYLLENRSRQGNTTRINHALQIAASEANNLELSDLFEKICQNIDKLETESQNKRLQQLLEQLAVEDLDMRPSRVGKLDMFNDLFDYLLENFAGSFTQESEMLLENLKTSTDDIVQGNTSLFSDDLEMDFDAA